MKRTDQQKLRVLLAGLSARLSENGEYFLSCSASLRTGARTLQGTLTPAAGGYLWAFGAEKRILSPEGFADAVLDAAPAYDGLTLVYRERGAVITVEADERGVRSRRSAEADTVDEAPAFDAVQHNEHLMSQRDYILQPSQAAPLLRAIGLLTADGKLRNDKIRKFNQIDAFLTRVRPLIEAIDADTVTVLDCACGKSYLSFALNYFLRDVLHRKCFITGCECDGEGHGLLVFADLCSFEYVKETNIGNKLACTLYYALCLTAGDILIHYDGKVALLLIKLGKRNELRFEFIVLFKALKIDLGYKAGSSHVLGLLDLVSDLTHETDLLSLTCDLCRSVRMKERLLGRLELKAYAKSTGNGLHHTLKAEEILVVTESAY